MPSPAHRGLSSRALRTSIFATCSAVVSSLALPVDAFAVGVYPVIISQPHYVAVNSGAAASFSVVATSATPVTYQWSRNGKTIAGATASTYTLPTTVTADNGAMFMVKVTNADGPAYSWNGQLVVMSRPTSPTTPPATPTVPPTTPPVVTAPIAPAPIAPAPTAPVSTPVSPSPAPAPAPVAVTAPVITKQPTYTVVTTGRPASFSVVATSTSAMTYQWLRNGAPIAGANASSYSIAAATNSDSGANFSVKIANAAGPTWSWNGQLIVNQPTTTTTALSTPAPTVPPVPTASTALPSISVQPQSAVVNGGQPASFAVNASSSGTATYQWLRAGVPIVGATAATYTIPAVQLADSGASFSVAITNSMGTVASAVARLTVNASRSNGATADRPFSDQSLWNSRPTKFTLGTAQLPQGLFAATLEGSAYSVKVAVASVTDAPVTVYALPGSTGIWVFDAETRVQQITIPHWPASVQPATGTDGHADIIDVAANKIHSFFQLKQVNGQWVATDYSWAPLDGSGWGEPGHYNIGARATGVPPTAGLVRPNELNDGLPAYRHALAMSLPIAALSASTPYVFPATSSDAPSLLKGAVSEGSLLMLPADFDLSKITDPRLLKVARTLQSFGAYVVDRNDATSFAIYVDIGANFKLMPASGWDMNISYQLEAMRAALRPVSGVSEWVDANGAVFTPNRNLNLMSMRGGWFLMQGATAGIFDSWSQSLVFPDNGQPTVQTNGSGNSMKAIAGTVPQAGQTYQFTVKATGGATLKLQLWDGSGQLVLNTFAMTDGHSIQIQWPANAGKSFLTATSGAQGGGTVSATLIKVGP